MARYRLTIAYDGTSFHGWQKQSRPAPELGVDEHGAPKREHLRTVQQALEDAVREVVREPVDVKGASRTDSGVHAWHQTAAFTASDDRRGAPDERLAQAINANLPDDIVVRSAVRTHDGFDPIGDCICKGYRYSLHVAHRRPLWDRAFVRHVWEDLDHERMHEAALRIEGERDFAAFAAAGHGRETTVRNVLSCAVTRPEPERIWIDVSADGFLWNMVRIIAGTLLEVGRGKMSPDDVSAALESLDRRKAGPTLEAHGLCLQWASYPGDAERPEGAGA